MRVTPVAYKPEQSIMGQKMSFGIICNKFCNTNGKYYIFHYFIFLKIREIPYSHNAKNSIGNNSGSVEDRAVQFTYSRGFAALADRMVLPPGLSRTGSDHAEDILRITPCGTIRLRYRLQSTTVAYSVEGQGVMPPKRRFGGFFNGKKLLCWS